MGPIARVGRADQVQGSRKGRAPMVAGVLVRTRDWAVPATPPAEIIVVADGGIADPTNAGSVEVRRR